MNVDYPNIAMSYNSIAVVYSKKGDYMHALESYEKALEIKDAYFKRFEKPEIILYPVNN